MYTRCRWNPNGNSIAVNFDCNRLNFIDTMKETTYFSSSLVLHDQGNLVPNNNAESNLFLEVPWIDWKSDGSLLASCSYDRSVSVMDIRNGKVVKRFKDIHLGKTSLW